MSEQKFQLILWLDESCTASEADLGWRLLRILGSGDVAARRVRVAVWKSRGWSNLEIAEQLGEPERTIERDVRALRDAMDGPSVGRRR